MDRFLPRELAVRGGSSVGRLEVRERPIDGRAVLVLEQRKVRPRLAVFRDRRRVGRHLVADGSRVEVGPGGVEERMNKSQRMLCQRLPPHTVRRGAATARERVQHGEEGIGVDVVFGRLPVGRWLGAVVLVDDRPELEATRACRVVGVGDDPVRHGEGARKEALFSRALVQLCQSHAGPGLIARGACVEVVRRGCRCDEGATAVRGRHVDEIPLGEPPVVEGEIVRLRVEQALTQHDGAGEKRGIGGRKIRVDRDRIVVGKRSGTQSLVAVALRQADGGSRGVRVHHEVLEAEGLLHRSGEALQVEPEGAAKVRRGC